MWTTLFLITNSILMEQSSMYLYSRVAHHIRQNLENKFVCSTVYFGRVLTRFGTMDFFLRLNYLLCTADVPELPQTKLSTFPDEAPLCLQSTTLILLQAISAWHLSKIGSTKMATQGKQIYIGFCHFQAAQKDLPAYYAKNQLLHQEDSANYICIHLEKRLTWRKHIETKRSQLKHKLRIACIGTQTLSSLSY